MKEDLDLEARAREWKKGFYPSDLQGFPVITRPATKQSQYERVQGKFEVLCHELGLGGVVRGLVRVVGRDRRDFSYDDVGGQKVLLQL
jgi:hypothetical protein